MLKPEDGELATLKLPRLDKYQKAMRVSDKRKGLRLIQGDESND
jgi:hypothetical protein